MNNGPMSASVICRVLEHRGLPIAPKFSHAELENIKDLASAPRAFRVNLKGLASAIAEDLIVVPTHGKDTKQIVKAMLSDATDRVMIAARSNSPELVDIASADARVKLTDFSDLYSQLCGIPDTLPSMILGRGRRDFKRPAYQNRYQKRLLRIIQTPDGDETTWGAESGASEYLAEWARAGSTRHPILLLGERGSGKTWQFFRFCEEMLALHGSEPWLYGPAFYFELREEYAQLGPYGVSVPVFSQAVIRDYPGVRYLWGAPLVDAFLSAGHTILCIDGFEEISHIVRGREEDAIELLRRICATLPLGTRFIIACRPSHFGSLDTLLNLQVWHGLAIKDAFEVLALAPFEQDAVERYLGAVTSVHEEAEAGRWLEAALGNRPLDAFPDDAPFGAAIREALRTCSKYPALLAAMVDYAVRRGPTKLHATDLIESALVDAMVDYNIQMGKAQPVHYRPNGSPVMLGTVERMELLSELVWDVAEKGQEYLDIRQLPPHVEKFFGLDLESALIDIRTHTLLEIGLIMKDHDTSGDDAPERHDDGLGVLRFAIQFSNDTADLGREDRSKSAPGHQHGSTSSRAQLLDDTAAREAPAGTKSVSGAFLLAAHVAKKFERASRVPNPTNRIGSVPFVDRLKALGQIPLGLAAAGILCEMIQQRKVITSIRSPQELVDLAVAHIAALANRHDKCVFSSCLRYLGHNLEAMGFISATERQEMDPWSETEVQALINGPLLLPGYKMVLVPSPGESAIPQCLKEEGIANSAPGLGGAFLLGVREVTNEDFLRFLSSPEGEEWRVERITIAGSAGGEKRSPYAHYANEYYLYLWEEARCPGISRHRPIDGHFQHPIGYVSWYACAAFCDWLTRAERPGQEVYAELWTGDESSDRGAQDISEFCGGYRLPAVREWSWAARGGRLDIAYPWELCPVALADADLQGWLGEPIPDSAYETERNSRCWMQKWRDDYRSAVLAMPKEHIPVLMDPFTPFGTSGMMGNVKEWCHDSAGAVADKRPILGTTSYLGENSFNYDYGMTLFPQNTNPDVGFRISRPLADKETGQLSRREEQLERLIKLPKHERT